MLNKYFERLLLNTAAVIIPHLSGTRYQEGAYLTNSGVKEGDYNLSN